MTPPFPSGLAPRTALRQAVTVLVLFYGVVYGTAPLVGRADHGVAALILTTLILGTLMLLATALFVRRDAAWRDSLGLGRQPVKSMLDWSLLGFIGTYAVTVALSSAYIVLRGNLEAQVAGRLSWLESFAQLPLAMILPLAAFVACWEETVFRGFLLGRLRASIPARDTRGAALRRDVLAVVLSALCFGAGHGYQGLLGLLQTTAAGLALGALAVWRKSLWPCIGTHLAIDTFGLLVLKALRPFL